MKYKKQIVLFVAFVSVAILSALTGALIYSQVVDNNTDDTDQAEPTIEQNPEQENESPESSEIFTIIDRKHMYNFEELGFTIKVPEDWFYSDIMGKANATLPKDATKIGFSTTNDLIFKISEHRGAYGWCEIDTQDGPSSNASDWKKLIIDGIDFRITYCGDEFMIIREYNQMIPGFPNIEIIGSSEINGVNVIEDVLKTIDFNEDLVTTYTCTYDDGKSKVSLNIPSSWTCTEEDQPELTSGLTQLLVLL